MQDDKETVDQKDTTETQTSDAQGITETQATDSPAATEESESTAEQANGEELDPAELKKKLDQANMELNQKRNKLEEIEKQREEARKAEMSEVERLKEELAQAQAERDTQEAIKLRDKFISEYPDEKVRKAAQALIERNPTNLSWGNVETEAEAKQKIHEQMDAIKENLGILQDEQDNQDTAPTVHANNPATNLGPEATKYADMDYEEMRKVLVAEGLLGESR